MFNTRIRILFPKLMGLSSLIPIPGRGYEDHIKEYWIQDLEYKSEHVLFDNGVDFIVYTYYYSKHYCDLFILFGTRYW